MAHAFNPSTWETKAGGSLCVWSQPGLTKLVIGQSELTVLDPVLKIKVNKLIKWKYDYIIISPSVSFLQSLL